ncbi:MAG TPA: hypothetical protein VIG44_00080, partial [Thermomicrobiales bacterium]
SDSHQAIASTTLHNDGAIQAPQGTTPFKQFSLDSVQAGQQIDLTIGPSPATPPQATTPTAQKSTFDRIREKATVPFLLILAGICLILMLLILRAPQRSPSSTAESSSGNPSATRPPTDRDAVEAGTDAERPSPSRRTHGRPHDYDLDDAEREIEAANTDVEETRDSRS